MQFSSKMFFISPKIAQGKCDVLKCICGLETNSNEDAEKKLQISILRVE